MDDLVKQMFDEMAEAALPLSAVAERSGTAQTTLARWKNGSTSPQFRVFARVRAAIAELKDEARLSA